MKLKINVVDAFTDKRFKGNSAAVIITESWLSNDLMQLIAMENNLSETAYLVKSSDGSYEIRWFSPLSEIEFCGHATLAAASVIFQQDPTAQAITFTADAVGSMVVAQSSEGYIEMDFPSRVPTPVDDIPEYLMNGLSIPPVKVLKNQQAYFVVYDNEDQVHKVEQDPKLIAELGPLDVVVTAKGEHYDFVSRYFWPANGGDEDPVTGSIHTGLAPYWAGVLNKQVLFAHQASKRGGVLRCEVTENRVIVAGRAVHYLEGEITV